MQRRAQFDARRMISLFFKVMTGVTISICVSGRVPTGINSGTRGSTPGGQSG